jgi:hypothetical protein
MSLRGTDTSAHVRKGAVAVVGVALLLGACHPAAGSSPSSSTISPPTTAAATTGVPADMLNPAVTQATIATTICLSGYTTTVRPPASVTEPIKRAQLAAYGYADTKLSDYEEDHAIAIEVGGAPASRTNLWPEPHSLSTADDKLEGALHDDVCSGRLTLAAAQARLLAAKTAHGFRRAASSQ